MGPKKRSDHSSPEIEEFCATSAESEIAQIATKCHEDDTWLRKSQCYVFIHSRESDRERRLWCRETGTLRVNQKGKFAARSMFLSR